MTAKLTATFHAHRIALILAVTTAACWICSTLLLAFAPFEGNARVPLIDVQPLQAAGLLAGAVALLLLPSRSPSAASVRGRALLVLLSALIYAGGCVAAYLPVLQSNAQLLLLLGQYGYAGGIGAMGLAARQHYRYERVWPSMLLTGAALLVFQDVHLPWSGAAFGIFFVGMSFRMAAVRRFSGGAIAGRQA